MRSGGNLSFATDCFSLTPFIQVAASSLFEIPFYNPNASAARITCPALVVAAEHDNLCMLQAALELKGLSPRVELVVLPCGKPHGEPTPCSAC